MGKQSRRARKRGRAPSIQPPLPHLYDEYAIRLLEGSKTARDTSYVARRHRPLSAKTMRQLWRWAKSHYASGRPVSKLPEARLSKWEERFSDPTKAIQEQLARLAERVFAFCEDFFLLGGRDPSDCLRRMRPALNVPASISDSDFRKIVCALNTREFKRRDLGTNGALLLQYRARRPGFLREFTNLT